MNDNAILNAILKYTLIIGSLLGAGYILISVAIFIVNDFNNLAG